MNTYIYRILHKPTGLFYCGRKGRWKDTITNLSVKGNIYLELKQALKVYSTDCKNCIINAAQTHKYNLNTTDINGWHKAKQSDFEIKTYALTELII